MSHPHDSIQRALDRLSINDAHDGKHCIDNLSVVAGLQDVVESLRELIGAQVTLCRVHDASQRCMSAVSFIQATCATTRSKYLSQAVSLQAGHCYITPRAQPLA